MHTALLRYPPSLAPRRLQENYGVTAQKLILVRACLKEGQDIFHILGGGNE